MSYNVNVSENQGVIRLLTLNHKVLRGLLLFGTVVGMGLTSAKLPVQASSKYVSIPIGEYVRTKKAMYVGITQKHGKAYKPLLIKKGALLQVYDEIETSHQVKASFSLGAVHYNKMRNTRPSAKENIPLTKTNFRKVALKAPIRTITLRQGTGFIVGKDGHSAAPLFYLTLDNYIQYYSKARVDHYDPFSNNWYILSGIKGDMYKPTASSKITKTTVNGNTTTVQYHPAIKGIPGKKIGHHKYQIKIKDLKKHDMYHDLSGSDDIYWYGGWNNYTVNGKPYYAGSIDLTD